MSPMTTSGVTYAQTRQITWVPYAPKVSGVPVHHDPKLAGAYGMSLTCVHLQWHDVVHVNLDLDQGIA